MDDFGLMYYNARWYDPALGRFAQADTVVANAYDPQAWDRYAYVGNNPVNNVDPSGHFGNSDDEKSDYWNRRNRSTVRDLEEQWREQARRAAALGAFRETLSFARMEMLTAGALHVGGSAGVGVMGGFGASRSGLVNFLRNGAIVTQDIALFIDTPFAFVEGVLIAGECMAGGEGCVAGALMGEQLFNGTGANAAESVFSLASLILTGTADFLGNGSLGESTGTSFVTFLAGGIMFDPIGDFVIDAYGAGYSNGFLNGIPTLMNGGPLVRP